MMQVLVMCLEAANIILLSVHTVCTSGESSPWHFPSGFCLGVKKDGNFCPVLCSASLIFPCGSALREYGCIPLGGGEPPLAGRQPKAQIQLCREDTQLIIFK